MTKATLEILTTLLPGLLAAWVFYSLTPHKSFANTEKIIHGLIFYYLISVISSTSELLQGGAQQTLIAVLLGTAVAVLSNTDSVHSFLVRLRVTNESSQINTWHSSIKAHDGFMLFHLDDGRRVVGLVSKFPVDPKDGHLQIMAPRWQVDGIISDEAFTESILIDASLVKWVELF